MLSKQKSFALMYDFVLFSGQSLQALIFVAKNLSGITEINSALVPKSTKLANLLDFNYLVASHNGVFDIQSCSRLMKIITPTFIKSRLKTSVPEQLIIALLRLARGASVLPMVAILSAYCVSDSKTFAQTKEAPSTDQISAELDRLNSASYVTREEAVEHLVDYPQQTIPLILERLDAGHASASNSFPEGTVRMLRLLSTWAVDPTSDNGREAVRVLEKLSEGTSTITAIRAQNLLMELTINYSDIVAKRLRSAGAFVGTDDVQVLTVQEHNKRVLRIDENFHGTLDDLDGIRWLVNTDLIYAKGKSITGPVLKRLIRLPNLRVLQLREVTLTEEELQTLSAIRNINSLELLYCPLPDTAPAILAELPITHSLRLFGTGLSSESISELKEQMEGVDLIFGRGGFLGIMTNADSNVIKEVVENGAAYLAGLRGQDQIVAINKVPIVKFSEIRTELAKYEAHEKVSIDFKRRIEHINGDGQRTWELVPMMVEVTLGMQEELNIAR